MVCNQWHWLDGPSPKENVDCRGLLKGSFHQLTACAARLTDETHISVKVSGQESLTGTLAQGIFLKDSKNRTVFQTAFSGDPCSHALSEAAL